MLRQDPITKKWVIFAPKRAKRPMNTGCPQTVQDKDNSNCPFCKGPYTQGYNPLLVLHNNGKWEQYVLPNKYPALESEKYPIRTRTKSGLSIEGFGIAEVIIETPNHNDRLSIRSSQSIQDLFKIYRERMIELFKDERVTQIIVFKNSGKKAGASQPHPHSQIYAMPIVPGHIRYQTECSRRFYDDEGLCPTCHILVQEMHLNERVVHQTPRSIAICPFAAEIPYTVHIYPLTHVTSLTLMGDQALDDLANTTQTVIKGMEEVLGKFDYNLVFDSAPRDDCDAPFFHLRIRIVPRISTPAGFEIATNMLVNPFLPEITAKEIKDSINKIQKGI